MFSFIYQECVGGLVFLAGLWLVLRSGEPGLTRSPRRWLWVLIGGFILLALLQGALQLAAL